jgi:hypothetical protein
VTPVVWKDPEDNNPALIGRRKKEMMNGMTEPRPSASSATENNFQALTTNIEELFHTLGALHERISPILVEDFPAESTQDSRGYSGPTGVSERLAILCSKTDDLITKVKYLTARVDL